MYHLINKEDKIKALKEAKRVLNKNGIIFIAYCMNDYSVINYLFKENKMIEYLNKNQVTSDFKTISKE